MKDINYQVGEKIRQIRYKAKYNIKTVSECVGISISTMSKIENGLTDISVKKLMEIAEFYGVKITELLPEKLLPNELSLKKQLEESRETIIELQGQLLNKERKDRYSDKTTKEQ